MAHSQVPDIFFTRSPPTEILQSANEILVCRLRLWQLHCEENMKSFIMEVRSRLLSERDPGRLDRDIKMQRLLRGTGSCSGLVASIFCDFGILLRNNREF